MPIAPCDRLPAVSCPVARYFSHLSRMLGGRERGGAIGVVMRSVIVPANTPPATSLGALSSGRPSGSSTVLAPGPFAPNGLFANHGRPNALLIEM